ncbi:sulfatase-like hydrolase/transferase [Thalassoroseus pseudoceratinae]|uniref:sulfatase-like hydrolase/transferase n=1 Tax=Thalassoroseus pseudoceratinae TaxID=2713176 RepID=UPI001420B375|nr:sulfatase-like hydrolase/transferase [Thalassoroseus pseudoceratinae]
MFHRFQSAHIWRLIALSALMIGSGIQSSVAVSAEDAAPVVSPNILLITADNLGFGDLPCYNPASKIKAPHLGRLAKSGAKLTSFYTASPTCTVSRACLLTGRIPQRHGLDYQLPGLDGNYGEGLSQGETLIPEILKTPKPAYATACFGKWNIGFANGSRPTERGFDEFVGHASGNMDYYTHNYNGKHDLYEGTKELHREGEHCTDLFADAAIDFIRRQSPKEQPWFVYLPFNAPHFPNARNKAPGEPNEWQAPDWAFKTYGMSPDERDPVKRYRAVVTALDAAIGRVLKSLDDLKIADDTLVFFYSDNGAFRLGRTGLDVGSNDPLRSGGVTCWEGGLRVVAMARWPKKIPAGITISEPCWSPDLLMTFATLTHAKLPADVVLDGKNILPVLTDHAKSPHESFYFRYRNHAALRKGNWKIVRENPKRSWQLFDLQSDPRESQNLADEKPQVVQELQSELKRWERSF